jgi:hypothetical protein
MRMKNGCQQHLDHLGITSHYCLRRAAKNRRDIKLDNALRARILPNFGDTSVIQRTSSQCSRHATDVLAPLDDYNRTRLTRRSDDHYDNGGKSR